ncbi:unnamed protein product [Effrenium voratum]|nr:unnamed protein product [Effrenium voratum]
MRQHLQQGFPTELMAVAAAERCWSTSFLVDWVAPDTLRLCHIEGKGRGLRSTRDIRRGETLMLQRPRAFASADVEEGQLVTSLDYEKRMVSDTSKVKMISQVTFAASLDMPLARVLSHLDDGSGARREVVDFAEFLHRLSPVVCRCCSNSPSLFPDGSG